MKTTNQLARFFAMIIFMVLFFILAGISKLAAQDCRDPLGYSWKMNYPSDTRDRWIFHLFYNPQINFPYLSEEDIVLDSVYVDYPGDALNLYSEQGENTVSKVYFCGNGEEILAFSTISHKRNKEKWPQIDEINTKVYGKKIGNIIYLREEYEISFLSKGTLGLIINLGIILIFTLCWFIEKISEIKRLAILSSSYIGGTLLAIFSIFSIVVALLQENFKWALICSIVYFSLLGINLFVNLIYEKILDKYSKDIYDAIHEEKSSTNNSKKRK